MDVQKLINELAEKEITLWCEGANLKYKAPKGAMTADLLSKIKSGKSEIIDFLNEHGNLQFVRNTKGRYEKFPLTDIQNSYVVGRNTMYELGGVACHGYIEMSFDKVLDIKRLEIAWNKVIQKHDMLRAIVSNSGYQIVQEAVPYVTIQCLDLRITEGNNETDKNDFRRRLANKQYELGKWPMCDLALTVENEKSIIHLSLDMLIADFVSTNIILHDLETFYENPDLIIVPTTLYRDVVLYQNQKRTIKTVERNVAEKYWSDKIPSMGEAPDFKLWDEFYQIENKFGFASMMYVCIWKSRYRHIWFQLMETSQTFRLLGEKYGKILNKLGYSNYILIGHCVGGLIALETAQYLQKKNVQVSDVTLISSNIPKQKNQTILSQATDEIYRKTLQSSLDNEILLERIFAKLIGADAYKAGYQVDEERLQQYIEYIVDQGTGDITVEALCNTGGKFEDVAKEFRLLASKSVSERLNALYNIIERPNGELMEHQLKMLNILFRVFSQNFRCVSTYEPKPYYGNMRILCCEIQGGHFYPGFFAEDYETWKPYAKGNLTFDLIKGWHLDCITEPNLGENIKKMLDFNY